MIDFVQHYRKPRLSYWHRVMAKNLKPFGLRLPLDTHAAIVANAELHDISIHEQIMTYIEWGLDTDNKDSGK